MAEVYRIVTADGQEFAYHASSEQLKKDHPGARITHRMVMDDLGQGSFIEFSTGQARAAERKNENAKGDHAKGEKAKNGKGNAGADDAADADDADDAADDDETVVPESASVVIGMVDASATG